MKKTRQILAKVRDLPPFPAVVHRVLALLNDPLVSAERIVEAVRYDQSITANVLKACNSALLAGTQRVTTLKDALVRIGNKMLIQVILSSAGSDVLRNEVRGYDLERGALWKHSVLCALMAESLCDVVKYDQRDKAFTAGLLHDVGKVVLNEFVGKEYKGISNAARSAKIAFLDAETGVLGINHAEVGGIIGTEWNFDSELVDAIRHHHDPARGSDSPLLFIVHLSDILCLTSGIGGGADGLQYSVDYPLLKAHGIGPKEFELGLIRLVEVENRFHGIVSMYE